MELSGQCRVARKPGDAHRAGIGDIGEQRAERNHEIHAALPRQIEHCAGVRFPAEMRLYADALGIDFVIVNGTVTVEHGVHTGELPGRVLRSGRDTYTPRLDA